MGIGASIYLAPYVYRRHASGRHQLLTPTADPTTLKVVVLQGSAMGYLTKRDLCAAIVRSYWSFTNSMEMDARRVPMQLRKALLRALHVEIRRLERLEQLAKRTRCPVALRRPGFRDGLERAGVDVNDAPHGGLDARAKFVVAWMQHGRASGVST